MSGTTLPHEVEGTFCASKVRLIPASPGTGVVAGGTVRAVLEMAGVTDCLTKCYGSTNKLNTVKAVFDGLQQASAPREQIAELRGVTLGTTEIEPRSSAASASCPFGHRGREDEAAPSTPSARSVAADAAAAAWSRRSAAGGRLRGQAPRPTAPPPKRRSLHRELIDSPQPPQRPDIPGVPR
jgi:small subunit ribosomal protein S5